MRRRRVLSLCALAVAGGTAGCSNGGTGGGGGNGGGNDGIDNQVVIGQIRATLEAEGAEIHTLEDGGDVITLEYSPGEIPEGASESEIESRVEETIFAVSEDYYEPIVGPGGGWRADRLEGTVRIEGTVVARFVLKTAWAEECEGSGGTRACIEERVRSNVERPQSTDSNGSNDSSDSSETTNSTDSTTSPTS